MPSSKSAFERPSAFALWMLFALTTGFFCLGNQSLPLIDRDEPRFAEAAREMMQRADRTAPDFVVTPAGPLPASLQWCESQFLSWTGGRQPRTDWIVPTFNGAARYDKPPLIYWMQIACYRLLGDNEFAARLPAAFCMGAIAVVSNLGAGLSPSALSHEEVGEVVGQAVSALARVLPASAG